MTTIHIDFETRSNCDLKKTGTHVYADDPTTDAWCMGWAIDNDPVEMWKRGDRFPVDIAMEMQNPDTHFVAHNASFELCIWNRLMTRLYDWPVLNPRQVRCTMAMAYAMALPGSLENAAGALGLEIRKDMEGRRLMMQMAQPRKVNDDGTMIWWDDDARLNRLYAYCKQDVEVERELEKRMLQLTPEEQAVWVLDQEINDRGVMVDLPVIHKAIDLVGYTTEKLDAELQALTGGAVRTSKQVAALTDWIIKQGVIVDGLAKADVLALLEDEIPDNVRRALVIRQEAAKSSTAKLKSMVTGANADGRVRGTMQYHGASTGRWAGRRLQPQNMPRGALPMADVEKVIELVGA